MIQNELVMDLDAAMDRLRRGLEESLAADIEAGK